MLQSRVADLERQLAELRQRNEKLDVSLEEALRELHQQQDGGGPMDAPSRGARLLVPQLLNAACMGGYVMGCAGLSLCCMGVPAW